MSSVFSSSQLGTYTSSHDGSTISGGTDREDFTPTQENLESLKRRIEMMKRENALLLEYAHQRNKDLFPQGTVIEANTRVRHNKYKKKALLLSTARKLEMATQVNENIETSIKNEQKRFSAEIESVKARLQQIGIRERELDKEIDQFIREINKDSIDERTGRIVGEKLLKWYDDISKVKETRKETLKLKKDSMQVKIKQTNARLEQKRDLGEKLQQVDYDQLQIDNEGFQEEIQKLSQQLAKLQKTSSAVVSRLQSARAVLGEEERECAQMQSSIEQKRKAIQKYEKEAVDVEADHAKFAALNEDIATKKSEYRVPDVADYIDKKAKLYEQARVLKNWERKVYLATMNVKRLQRELDMLDTSRG